MVDTLFLVPLQIFAYVVGLYVCEQVWRGARSLLLAGYFIQALTDWIQTNIFGPSIEQVGFISDGLLPMFATVAVWLLAFSYLASPLFKVRVVDWKKALGWFMLATVFFHSGPGLYRELENLRREFGGVFYSTVLAQAEDAGGIPTLSEIHDLSDEVPMMVGPGDVLINQFGDIFGDTDHYIDGLDIAMSYMHAGRDDVLAPLDEVPGPFGNIFFPPESDTEYWLGYSNEDRLRFIGLELVGIIRLLLGYIIVFFGLVEQLIYLCLAIAAGILFVDLMIALPFALFERTELMARSILDMMLELFIFTCIVAALQAVVIGVIIVAANTLKPTLALGASIIGLLFETVLLIRAGGAIVDASKRMFSAMSQVVGGRIMAPGEAAMAGATAAGAAAVGVATAGAGAIGAYAATGSLASAAGSALAGSDKLFNVAALGQMSAPEGALKDKLSSFYEGALAQRVMPGIGPGLMLRDGGKPPKSHVDAEAAADETREAARQQATADRLPAGGEQDIRFDAADMVQLREALATALAQAIRATPQGGYRSEDQALNAISRALTSLGRNPRTDPAMSALLAREQKSAVGHVMTGHLTLKEEAQMSGPPPPQGGSEGSGSARPGPGSPSAPSGCRTA